MQEEKESSYQDEIIDLGKLLSIFWKEKVSIIVISSIFAVFSVIYSLNLPDIYKSESLLTVQESSGNNAPSLSGYGGLASMMGVNLVSSGQDKGKLAMEILTSREFIKSLLNYDLILPSIMAVKNYDKETSSLVFDSDIYNVQENKWKGSNGDWTKKGPTYLEVYEEYLALLEVNEDPITGFIKISISHQSPEFSKEFLEMVIFEVNDQLREKDLKESDLALDFLKSEASTATVMEIKRSISNLIQNQLEIQMMAKINEEYVLKIIEPPFVPEKKFKPSRARICILLTLLGVFFGAIFALAKYNFKKEN